jgi:hypothetical protein
MLKEEKRFGAIKPQKEANIMILQLQQINVANHH